VLVERFAEGRPESAVVFGKGVGFWKNRAQVSVDRETLEAIEAAFEEARFSEMPDKFGTGRKRVRTRVERETAAGTKQVIQLFAGEQSASLDRLAARVLDLLRPAGERAEGPSGLEDGLAWIAAGDLAPEALTLVLQRKPRLDAPAGTKGFLIQALDGTVTRRDFRQGEGYADAQTLPWREQTFQSVARRLAEARIESLPDNLFADDMTSLEVRVLRHRKRIEARDFAGLTRKTRGEAQARFDDLLADLERLAEKVPPTP
jgi:hypothetical protein